jgi:hypothetical protein
MGCRECKHCFEDSIDTEPYTIIGHYCSENYKNTKFFPFEGHMPCFEADIWLTEFCYEYGKASIDNNEEKLDAIWKKYKDKYKVGVAIG